MKKLFTLRNIVLFAGALVLLVVFCLSFAATIKVSDSGHVGVLKNIIWGCSKFVVDGEVTTPKLIVGVDKVGPATLPFVGMLLILVALLGAVVVALLVKKPWAKWVVVGLAVLAITGAVFQFFAIDQFIRVAVNALAKQYGITDKNEIAKAIAEYKHIFAIMNAKAVMSTLLGVFGIVGGLAVGASQFLPEKK